MIVILKDGTKQDQVAKLQQYFEGHGPAHSHVPG